MSMALAFCPGVLAGELQQSEQVAFLPAAMDSLISRETTAVASAAPRSVQVITGEKKETVVYRNPYAQAQQASVHPVSWSPAAKTAPSVDFVARYIAGYNRKISWPEANAMAQAIVYYSQAYGVDYRLTTGVMAVESSFRTDAVSSSGAIGLGQLKPDTARWLGVSDPYNPVDNIAGTTRFLGWLLKKYNGSLDHALSAYYQGPGTVDRSGITPACMPYLIKVNKALGGMS